MNILIMAEVDVKDVEELQEVPELLRPEVLKQNVEFLINKNRYSEVTSTTRFFV